jgi:hypothetical protein
MTGICADVLQVALAEHEGTVSEQVFTELGRALQKKFRTSVELARRWMSS